jgi:endoglucanase
MRFTRILIVGATRRVAPMLVILSLVLSTAFVSAQSGSAIPANIRQGLAAGSVGLIWGFYDTQAYNPREWDADLPRIRAMGAGAVRVYISWDVMFGSPDSTTLIESRYQDLIALMGRIRNAGLVTIVDMHNTRQRMPNSTLWNDDYMVDIGTAAGRSRHISGLTTLVSRLSRDADTNWFVFQPANEPIFSGNPSVWYNHQIQLLPALRAACPNCVLFAVAHDWQGVNATVNNLNPAVAPYNDPRLIFDVHFYEPIEFTHCGYRSATHQCNDPERQYPGWITSWRGREYWDINLMRTRYRALADWARRHNVLVFTSEIGVFTQAIGRAQYLRDLTQVLREYGIGFSIHAWTTDNFGISNSPDVIAAIWGQATPPTPTPIPQATQVNGTIRIDGRSNHAMPLAVTVFRNNAQIASFSATSSSSGTFSIALTGVSAGAARIIVKPQNALGVGRDVTLVGGAMTIDFGSTSPGDLNNDNAVSLSDFSIFATSFNTVPGQPRYDARADLNADNAVSLPDFSLLSSNFNETGVSR